MLSLMRTITATSTCTPQDTTPPSSSSYYSTHPPPRQPVHSALSPHLICCLRPILPYTLLAMSGSLLLLPPMTVMSLYFAPPRQQQLRTPHMYRAMRYQKAIRYRPESQSLYNTSVHTHDVSVSYGV